MTHDERMHACLYSNDGRVELCERLCSLEAENEHLRGNLADYVEEAAELRSENEDLRDENARLRELATLMRTFHDGSCSQCRWHEECLTRNDSKCIAPQKINEIASELGVEWRRSDG